MTAGAIFQVVTANRVHDGVPVYFTETGQWSQKIADAACLTDAAPQLAAATGRPLDAIAPYIIEVTMTGAGPRPIGLREEIRAFGPTA